MGLDLFGSTIVWMIIIGGLSFKFRKEIAKKIKIIPLPDFLLFMIVGTIYSIVEQNINCPSVGCTLFPITIPIFVGFLLLLLGIVKMFDIDKVYIGIIIFGMVGWVAEFLMGGHMGIMWSSPEITALVSVWAVLTYSVIAIIPLTILLGDDK